MCSSVCLKVIALLCCIIFVLKAFFLLFLLAGLLGMADDIDIEEHDVLDNPIIRNIFPDISVIKEEIAKYYDDGKGFMIFQSHFAIPLKFGRS